MSKILPARKWEKSGNHKSTITLKSIVDGCPVGRATQQRIPVFFHRRFSRDTERGGWVGFSGNPDSISRPIPRTLCASLLREAIVPDQYERAAGIPCLLPPLRRPRLSLSTASVETENPFKPLTPAPPRFIPPARNFLP